MTSKYNDIINMEHHISKKHKRMSQRDRAAQFAPFTALNGYYTAVNETSRYTESKIELDEEKQSVLNKRMEILIEHLGQKPDVCITFFKKDKVKDGGKYISKVCKVKRVDFFDRMIILDDDTKILFDDVYDIKSEIFNFIDFV